MRGDSMDHEYTVQALSPAQVRAIYAKRMPEDFPPDEIKSLAIIERSMAQGHYMCYGCFDGDAMLAYLFFVVHGRNALIDYLAVDRGLRGRGIGSQFLQALIAGPLRALDAVMLETEDPAFARNAAELDTRNRRLQFYLRNGLTDTRVRATVSHVPYVVLSLPVGKSLTAEAVHTAYTELYRAMLPNRLYRAMIVTHPLPKG